jgi:hypothetical protein
VGLSIPEGVPLGAPVAPAKYAASLAARLGSPDAASALKGIDNLRAQYYGVRAVLDDKRKEAAAKEAAALGGGTGGSGA